MDVTWAELIDFIRSGDVVPVVGPDLLWLTGVNGERTLLEAEIARRLAVKLEMPPPAPGQRVRHVAYDFVSTKGLSRRRLLRPRLAEVMADLQAEQLNGASLPPPALDLLAQITAFKLFVCIPPDSLLEDALNRVRFSGRSETLTRTNAPTLRAEDLPGDLRRLDASIVFYPFGRLADSDFAITEEDTLEFLFRLFEKASELGHLFEALQRSHLLFLGCNFPDWLTRFWIRALAGKRLTSQRDLLEVVADRSLQEDKSLVLFLHRTEVQMFEDGGPEDFVKKLHEHWVAREKAAPRRPAEAKARRAQVFISYSMTTDREAAQRINARLQDAGIETWFDDTNIASGQRVLDELRQNIERATLFLPVLSKNAAARTQGFYRAEWDMALEYAKRRSPELPFIHPVVVDDLRIGADGIPPALAQITAEYAPNGQLSEKFVAGLRALVRKAQL